MADSAAIKSIAFNWEGTDRKGKKIKGKTIAANEAAVRAEQARDASKANQVLEHLANNLDFELPQEVVNSAAQRSSASRV